MWNKKVISLVLLNRFSFIVLNESNSVIEVQCFFKTYGLHYLPTMQHVQLSLEPQHVGSSTPHDLYTLFNV